MVSKEKAKEILKKYEEAWVEEDINKILSIYAEDATYHEKATKPPYKGHKEIGHYWKTKVCEEQSKIEFELLNMYVAGDTIIAEWKASFNSEIEQKRIHLKSVAIFETKNNLITHSREYWDSKRTQLK